MKGTWRNQKHTNIGFTIIIALALLSVIGLLIAGPIVQDEAYHLFADSRKKLGIPNFWNVVSNVPFLIIGVLGLYNLKDEPNKYIYQVFCLGVILMSFGSAYYHWRPTTGTLFWDRLPMTIAFMSLFAIVINEFISTRRARQLFLPLLLFGIFSVIYWRISDDLRLYALVQFFPLLAMPLILILFNSAYTNVRAYWLLLIAYLIAKVFEHYDMELYELLNVMSGHSLKHFMAGVGLFLLVDAFGKRERMYV